MIQFVTRRVLLAIPVLIGVITIAFIAVVTAPGDPLAAMLPENPTPEQRAQVAREFGVDRSIGERWLYYVSQVSQGNLGRSIRTRRAVATDLRQAAVATLELAGVAFVIVATIGVGIGVLCAVRENRVTDHLLSIVTVVGVATPVFWTALMLQLLFYGWLDWLPAGGQIDDFMVYENPFERWTGLYLVDTLVAGNLAAFGDTLLHLLLPATVLAYRAMGLVVRVTRTTMLEVLRSPYIQTARAFGVPERRVVLTHAFRNALPPVLTVLGLAAGELLAGSILVETVFNWPGLGLYTLQSIVALDFPGVIGVSLFITVVYVLINLLIDLIYPTVDPRLRST